MAWVNIPDTATDPDAPLTSSLAKAWTGNPIAIANGEAGAPRIDDTALSATVKQAGRDWVAQRISTAPHTAVGQYVMAVAAVGQNHRNFGSTINGSVLRPSNGDGSFKEDVGLPGTYRCMGRYAGGTSSIATLWLRVS